MPIKNFLILLLTAMIWGTAFVGQALGMEYVPPFTFTAGRSLFGALVLVPGHLFSGSIQESGAPGRGIDTGSQKACMDWRHSLRHRAFRR
ncbi:MAG: DMT family transporter [Dakarella massiliensis]